MDSISIYVGHPIQGVGLLNMHYIEDDMTGQIMKRRHVWEPFSTAMLFYIAEEVNAEAEDFIFLDIGANFGYYGHAVSMFYPKAEVHCFEPRDSNIEIIEANLKNSNSIQLHPYAIDKEEGTFDFWIAMSNSGGNTLALSPEEEAQGDEFQKTTCEVKPLDYFDIDYSKAKLVKVDVQGKEVELLRQLNRLIPSGSYIMIETCPGLEQAATEMGFSLVNFKLDSPLFKFNPYMIVNSAGMQMYGQTIGSFDSNVMLKKP